jgi:hypothetical protein
VARNNYCPRCDIRKLKRSSGGDKVERNKDGSIKLEYLGYVCSCGRKWRQKIDYAKSGRKTITWKKIS